MQSLYIHSFRLFILLLLLISLSACSGKKEEPAVDKPAVEKLGVPKIVAVEPDIDFGQVKQGENVERVYTIKNEGDADLEIEKARGS